VIPQEYKHPKDYEVLDYIFKRGDAQELSRILSCSPQLIRDWCRPVQPGNKLCTGRYNPLSRLRAIIMMITNDDGSPERAHPIGHYIADLLQGVFVPLPPPCNMDSEIFRYCSDVFKEASEAVEAARKSWCEITPGKITQAEAREIRRECQEAMGAIQTLMRWADENTEED